MMVQHYHSRGLGIKKIFHLKSSYSNLCLLGSQFSASSQLTQTPYKLTRQMGLNIHSEKVRQVLACFLYNDI